MDGFCEVMADALEGLVISTTPPPPTLLTLPRELRDLVWRSSLETHLEVTKYKPCPPPPALGQVCKQTLREALRIFICETTFNFTTLDLDGAFTELLFCHLENFHDILLYHRGQSGGPYRVHLSVLEHSNRRLSDPPNPSIHIPVRVIYYIEEAKRVNNLLDWAEVIHRRPGMFEIYPEVSSPMAHVAMSAIELVRRTADSSWRHAERLLILLLEALVVSDTEWIL